MASEIIKGVKSICSWNIARVAGWCDDCKKIFERKTRHTNFSVMLNKLEMSKKKTGCKFETVYSMNIWIISPLQINKLLKKYDTTYWKSKGWWRFNRRHYSWGVINMFLWVLVNHVFDQTSSRPWKAMLSIMATKGFSFGLDLKVSQCEQSA